MIQGVIFDLDGTLLDSMQVWRNLGDVYLRSCDRVPRADLAEQVKTMTFPEAAAYFQRTYDLPDTPQQIMAQIMALLHHHYEHEFALKPGALAALQHLHRCGLPLSIATATRHEMADVALRRLGVRDLFCGIFTCDEVGAGKDRPTVYLAAQAHMGTALAHTIVVEDVPHGIQTAKGAGFLTLAVFDQTQHENEEALRAHADYYLPHWDELDAVLGAVLPKLHP